jgi:hypothetical protein
VTAITLAFLPLAATGIWLGAPKGDRLPRLACVAGFFAIVLALTALKGNC